MASPELAIAKVNLSAVFFRKEPTALTRPEIESFHDILSDTILRCSPSNVQKCKRWILSNVRPSSARCAALAKYLVALAGSLAGPSKTYTKPSPRRRQLHILYILNDALYHVSVRERDDAFAKDVQPSLTALFAHAANHQNCPKHVKKLEDLVSIWEEQRYFPASLTEELRDAIRDGASGAKRLAANPGAAPSEPKAAAATTSGKDAPYLIPAFHGDQSTAWHDLPAGNWLPHLTPNSTRPMRPEMIKPLQLAPGPADKALAKAVRGLLMDAARIYGKETPKIGKAGDKGKVATGDVRDDVDDDEDQHVIDLNEMGERVIYDEITGDIIGGETYYGWSRGFCDKMKQRRKKGKTGSGEKRPGSARSHGSYDNGSRSPSPARGRSRPASRSESPPAFKRRRVSPSRSHSRSRSRGRGGMGYSRQRSAGSRSRSRTRSRDNRSGSPEGRYNNRRSSPYGGNRPPSGNFGSNPPPHHSGGPPSRTPSAPPPAPVPHHQHIPGPIPPPYHPPPPMAGGGFAHINPPPPIPPPPQGYQGVWPPPPPPPNWFPPAPQHGGAGPGNGNSPGSNMGWQGQPPPPPPPQQYGGRGGGYRGGRGGGRGRGW